MTVTWTRISDPDGDTTSLPSLLIGQMFHARQAGGGSFGLMLTGGDVLRVTALAAAYVSSTGTILLDVALDDGGVPEGVDAAWRGKHFLGAPMPGATSATVNLAQVVAVVELLAVADVELASDETGGAGAEATVEGLRQVAEAAVTPDRSLSG